MSKFIRKNWPLAGIALLVLMVGFYVLRSGKEVVRKPIPSDGSQTGVKLEDVHFTHEGSEQGLRWTLDAKEVRISEDRQHFSFTSFLLRLEPQDRGVIHLEGKSGQYDKALGRLNLSGDLRGRTDDGYTIRTERAVFNQKEGRLVAEDAVTITGPSISVEGTGLNYHVATETLEIQSNVTTIISTGSLKL